jgi:hypothetical protein
MTDTITISGKEYPVRISHIAIKKWRQQTERGIETLGQKPGDLELLLLEGLKVGAKVEKKVCAVTLDAIDEWLDEDMTGNLGKISEIISRAFPTPEPAGNEKKG